MDHANTILDDVNRFAFAIIEKGNYPLDAVIPKGDFEESGIYELEGYQDLGSQQFSITVKNVPYGVCDALLEKAAVRYIIRVNESGSDKQGLLYSPLHTDLCHDNNNIVLYFGDTTDLADSLACSGLPKCIQYSSDCKCIACEEGYQLSVNDTGTPDGQYCVANSCKATGVEGCTSNADCCKSTDFCSFGRATGCTEVSGNIGTPSGVTTGICAPVSAYGIESIDIEINGTTMRWTRSKGYGYNLFGTLNLNWWSAKNWCERQKRADGVTPMKLASAADLDCGYFPDNETTGKCGVSTTPGKKGTILEMLRAEGWSEYSYHWLSDTYASCNAYILSFKLGDTASYNRDNIRFALCH